MRLSTRARYGLRAAVDLALYYEREPVSMASIAERHGISRKYLHTILSQLKSSVRALEAAEGHAPDYGVRDPFKLTQVLCLRRFVLLPVDLEILCTNIKRQDDQ